MEVVEIKVTLGSDIEIHSGKVPRLTYTVSVGGLPEANVNQLKPFSLILNLSQNFIVIDIGKGILLSLKVMLTSFQSISTTSQI